MTRLADVRILSYSGKLGLPSLVLARPRRSPPVSTTIGRLSLEISEEFGFVAEFVVRRLEEACRGRAAAGVIAGRHHPQPLAHEGRGGVPCRPGSLQSADILLFEPNRRRNQARHTFTIHNLTPERHQPPSTLL